MDPEMPVKSAKTMCNNGNSSASSIETTDTNNSDFRGFPSHIQLAVIGYVRTYQVYI